MRILILNWRDIRHPLSGGAETATHEHAKGWIRAGHKVKQFSSLFNGGAGREIIDGVEIIRSGSHYTVHFHAYRYYQKYARKFADLVVDEFHFVPFFTPLYARCKKLAFIHELARELWFKNHIYPVSTAGYFLEPYFFKIYQRIPFMTVSQSTKNDLINMGLPPKNVHIVKNGVYATENNFKKNSRPTLIYLGRLAADKGVEDAVKIMPLVKREIPGLILWIAGREETVNYKRKLINLVKKLNLEDAVSFFDYVDEKKKCELFKKAWVFVNPTMREGWGLTVIEAAAQKTPTAGYDVPGLRDSIHHGKTGVLVYNRDFQALADVIIKLMKNQEARENMASAALSWSKNFFWERSVKESLELIESL